MHRHIVEEDITAKQAARSEIGQTVQDCLLSSDGLKLYECLFWYFQRTAKMDSSIVTFREFWRAVEQNPEVSANLLPGLFRMQWVLDNIESLDEATLQEV